MLMAEKRNSLNICVISIRSEFIPISSFFAPFRGAL